jgi:hypothetical protein
LGPLIPLTDFTLYLLGYNQGLSVLGDSDHRIGLFVVVVAEVLDRRAHVRVRESKYLARPSWKSDSPTHA